MNGLSGSLGFGFTTGAGGPMGPVDPPSGSTEPSGAAESGEGSELLLDCPHAHANRHAANHANRGKTVMCTQVTPPHHSISNSIADPTGFGHDGRLSNPRVQPRGNARNPRWHIVRHRECRRALNQRRADVRARA